MESESVRLNIKDFEYTISDSNGMRGVKEGKEYPITMEEWVKAHPKHRDVQCSECKFALDEQTILLHFVPRETREKATERPRFIGKFNMLNWTGHASFYIFKCLGCEIVVVDSPHGYHGDFMYLRCHSCDYCIDLNKSRYREIYSRDNLHVPMFMGFVAFSKVAGMLMMARLLSIKRKWLNKPEPYPLRLRGRGVTEIHKDLES